MAVTDISFAKSPRVRAVQIVVAGLITGFLTPLAAALTDHFHLFRATGGLSLTLGGVPFALLVMLIARRISLTDWWRALVLGLVTLIAFEIAITAAANTSIALTGRPEPVRNILGGLAGGFVGSGLMALAAVLLRVGTRRVVRWLPMLAVGTFVGTLLAVDSYLRSDWVWGLFPVWQASVAFVLTRTLEES